MSQRKSLKSWTFYRLNFFSNLFLNFLLPRCLNGFLRKRIRILVTHQLGFISRANKILLLNNGELIAKGSFEDLLRLQPDLINSLMTSDQNKKDQQTEERLLSVATTPLPVGSSSDLRCGSQTSIASMASRVLEVIFF
jgi:ABC-type multidrug transport system ATPase subunit